jgi:hypothetical protein
MTALEARIAYMKLPAEYRAIPDAPAITRGELASLIAIRLAPLLERQTPLPVVVTDTRSHWAEEWIMAVARAGVIEAYENHTFQPGTQLSRSDLAHATARLLKIIAADRPQLLKDWQSRQQKMADVGVSNLRYADVSLAVASGVLPLAEGGLFQLTRPVSGAEAIDAVNRIERLYTSPQ